MKGGGPYLRLGFVAAIATILAFIVGIIVGRGAFDTIKDWQTLIGALVACAAVGVAYINVSRQVRMNVILREEKIINDEMPGLMDALNFLMFFNFRMSNENGYAGASKVLESYRFGADTHAARLELDKYLPQTTMALRSSIAGAIAGINFAIQAHQVSSTPGEDDNEGEEDRAEALAFAAAELERAKEHLQQLEKNTKRRVAEWSDLLPKLREAIERYLNT